MEKEQSKLDKYIVEQMEFKWRKYVKVDWTKEEDSLLTRIITFSKRKIMWSKVSRQLNSDFHMQEVRTGKQCKKRWLKVLLPLKNYEQTEEKEQIILQLHQKFRIQQNIFYEEVKKEISDLNRDQIKLKLESLIELVKQDIKQENVSDMKVKHQLCKKVEFEVVKKQKQSNQNIGVLCRFLMENL